MCIRDSATACTENKLLKWWNHFSTREIYCIENLERNSAVLRWFFLSGVWSESVDKWTSRKSRGSVNRLKKEIRNVVNETKIADILFFKIYMLYASFKCSVCVCVCVCVCVWEREREMCIRDRLMTVFDLFLIDYRLLCRQQNLV